MPEYKGSGNKAYKTGEKKSDVVHFERNKVRKASAHFFLDSCNKEICGKSSNIYVTHLFPLFSGLSMMFSIAENIPRCFYSSDLYF